MIQLHGGPWNGERRRFRLPLEPTVIVTSGGEYRLEQTYLGNGYRWYPQRLDDKEIV